MVVHPPLGTQMGRNSPCPCGSGRKHKNCCATNGGTTSSSAVDSLHRYALACKVWQKRAAEDSRNDIDWNDYLNSAPSLEQYTLVMNEIIKNMKILLLPIELPGIFSTLINGIDNSDDMMKAKHAFTECSSHNNYTISKIDLYKTKLGPILKNNDYNFNIPPNGGINMIFRRQSKAGYAPQYVSNAKLFSEVLSNMVMIPIIKYSNKSYSEFNKSDSVNHECLHVIQRIFRKAQIPHYIYVEDNKRKIRNPIEYVSIGIQDEIEVQVILTRAGDPFSINPIIYHKKNLMDAFSDYPREEMIESIRAGIESIPFEKYSELVEGRLREIILQEYLRSI